eukprot:CAMPEP_0201507340 /NCGR_PEP_ID=MMETSP0161_2-20130828/1030_1 /ASSEMBLY_ACC=CAM_ASM_000251 /TAXON_ID=180227 /ORGANISM="Neoparamoeba aestuarina, Strain SoJaBio B1-5/56/2" /LENGTH=57 /DNA_ID=CAMNT_0047901677 /DNA_START=127 /DNA_END=297 /DNA_ORIENTATION=+
MKQESQWRPKKAPKEDPMPKAGCLVRAKNGSHKLTVIVPSTRVKSFHVNLSKLIEFH